MWNGWYRLSGLQFNCALSLGSQPKPIPITDDTSTGEEMIELLIPEKQLPISAKLLGRLEAKVPSVNWRSLEVDSRLAYARYVALLDPELRDELGVDIVSESIAFYNAYFWILVFAKRFQAHHGPDAGIEQECLKVLERAPDDVDWQLVESVAQAAEQG
ncbi:MAG TPA: hypothetical protein VF522_06315 [Ramlibacter sp.]|uniref:hypothetical protein n=1 Tax=Ramlibacter sp. TaxID=1917967 RepID=UPI002ED01E8B